MKKERFDLKIPTGKSEPVTQKTDNAMTETRGTKRQTIIYKTKKRLRNSGAPEGLSVPAPLVTPTVLLKPTRTPSDVEIVLEILEAMQYFRRTCTRFVKQQRSYFQTAPVIFDVLMLTP